MNPRSGRRRRCRSDRERGSGTVLALGMAMVLGLVASATVAVGQATTVRHRAEDAADLAALAAAQVAQTGGDGCAAAARLAAANDGRLVSCVRGPGGGGTGWTADDVVVRVSVSGTALGGRALTAVAQARAGRAAP